MSEESAPRKELRRLVARHHLSRTTLTLIAQVTLPKVDPEDKLDDRQVHSVNQAIDVLVLSGLGSDAEIAAALREAEGERRCEGFWRERLTLAAAWDAHGRPEPPAPVRLATVPPIPPQPPSEISGDAGKNPRGLTKGRLLRTIAPSVGLVPADRERSTQK